MKDTNLSYTWIIQRGTQDTVQSDKVELNH